MKLRGRSEYITRWKTGKTKVKKTSREINNEPREHIFMLKLYQTYAKFFLKFAHEQCGRETILTLERQIKIHDPPS